MLVYKQTILYIAILFSIGSENTFESLVIDQGVEGVINGTTIGIIDWEDRHLEKARAYNPESAVIRNDIVWYDHKHKPIKANRCGTISHKKINGEWYMVGSEAGRNFTEGGDIYLYKSATLGSDSWYRVKKIHTFSADTGDNSASCEIIQRYDNQNIIIVHCRQKVFISYSGIEGKYNRHTRYLRESTVTTDGSTLSFGGSSTYQEGKDLYLVTSRLNKTIDGERTRSLYIYKMNANWTAINDYHSPTVKWVWNKFESPMVTKMGKMYYIFASKTHGWGHSKTYYRRARRLKKLARAKTSEVVFHPANTPNIQSMGSQFCFFQKFARGKWMFGGRRHPVEAPELYAEQYGQYVMAPAKFINHVPHVYWKYSFNWKKYNYRNPSSDSHNHFGYGHKSVPCIDSTDKFVVQFSKNKKWRKGCGWLDNFTTRYYRCNRHRELQIKCPVSCKTFGCK